MVTVREQLPDQLNELSDESTVEHAEEAQYALASWLDRVRGILDGAELIQLEEVAQLVLQKELATTANHRTNTFATGIGMADILAHLHVDEDTLSSAVLYRSVREGLTTLEEIQKLFGEHVYNLVRRGELPAVRLGKLIRIPVAVVEEFEQCQTPKSSPIGVSGASNAGLMECVDDSPSETSTLQRRTIRLPSGRRLILHETSPNQSRRLSRK